VCPWSSPPLQIQVTARPATVTASARRATTARAWCGQEHGLPAARFRMSASVGSLTPIGIYVPPPNMLDLAEVAAVEYRAQDIAQD